MNELIIIERLSVSNLKSLKVFDWPIWEKNVCTFDWEYDTEEKCYFIEGKVKIKTPQGEILIQKGDFVTFKKGLKCTWEVLEPVKKHYNFS